MRRGPRGLREARGTDSTAAPQDLREGAGEPLAVVEQGREARLRVPRPEHVAQRRRQRRDLVARVPVRVERDRRAQAGHAAALDLLEPVVDEARLAEPRVRLEQDHPSVPPQGRCPRPVEVGHLGLAADERDVVVDDDPARGPATLLLLAPPPRRLALAEQVCDPRGVAQPPLGRGLEQPVDDGLEERGHLRHLAQRRPRGPGQGRSGRRERPRVTPGHELEQEQAQRVEVGRGADLEAVHLLRRRVDQRPHEVARPREAHGAVAHECQPEVEQADLLPGRHQDVLRLDVAMDEPRRVDGCQRLGDALPDRAREPLADAAPLVEQLAEVAALHVLEGDPRGVLPHHARPAGVQRAHDARVIDAPARVRLPQEALDGPGHGEEVRMDELDRRAPPVLVDGIEHTAHPAAPDLPKQPPASEACGHARGRPRLDGREIGSGRRRGRVLRALDQRQDRDQRPESVRMRGVLAGEAAHVERLAPAQSRQQRLDQRVERRIRARPARHARGSGTGPVPRSAAPSRSSART